MCTPQQEQEDDTMHDPIHMSGDSEAQRAIVDARLARDWEALRAVTDDRLPSLAETARQLQEHRRRRGVARRVIVAGSMAAACSTALAAPLLLTSVPEPKPAAVGSRTIAVDAGRPVDAARAAAAKAQSAKEARAKRDVLRREIARHAATSPAKSAAPVGAIPYPKASSPKRSEEAPESAPTGMRNELGPSRTQLVAYLNKEFSPLIDECVAQAAARSPKLAGMYAIGIETLAYEELGAIVDSAEPAARNEVSDPEFLECIRESAFTLIIPPPLTTGQEKFELTGYVGPPPPRETAPTGP
jgi:hypothetical protein